MRMKAILGAVGAVAVLGGTAAWLVLSRAGVRVVLEPSPPSVTAEPQLRLRGQVLGVTPALSLNGTPVVLTADGHFEHTLPLTLGSNAITLSAVGKPKDGAPEETVNGVHVVERLEQAVYDTRHFYTASGGLSGFTRGATGLKAARDSFLTGDVDVELKAGELTGSVLESYENANRPVKGGMPMMVELAVGGGAVRVALKPEEGTVQSEVARPGAPVTLRGRSELHHGKYHVRLEALDAAATDVMMRVRY